MNNNVKVSVIIPVHNSEEYLEKCINSILNQTLKEIEIIAIENGSIDNSLKVLKKFDKYITIFSLSKPSISEARNKGIKASNGKYILFFDSDDFMNEDMCEKMYLKAEKENLDLVTSDYYKLFNDKTEIFETEKFENSNIEDNNELLWNINYGPIKLFKKDIIDKNTIVFPENIKYEDIPFVFNYLIHANKIGKINEPLFTYVIHSGSETITRDKKVFDIFKSLDIINTQSNITKYKEALTSLNTKIITNYTIQQRYQKNKKIRNEFINKSFNYLNTKFPNWRKCKFFKTRNKLKALIEKNKKLTKTYCNIYRSSYYD